MRLPLWSQPGARPQAPPHLSPTQWSRCGHLGTRGLRWQATRQPGATTPSHFRSASGLSAPLTNPQSARVENAGRRQWRAARARRPVGHLRQASPTARAWQRPTGRQCSTARSPRIPRSRARNLTVCEVRRPSPAVHTLPWCRAARVPGVCGPLHCGGLAWQRPARGALQRHLQAAACPCTNCARVPHDEACIACRTQRL